MKLSPLDARQDAWSRRAAPSLLLPPHTLPTFEQLIPWIARPIDTIDSYFYVPFLVMLLYMLLVAIHPRVRQQLREMQQLPAPDASAQPQ